MDGRVKDYPDLIKRGGGVVNINRDEYLRAKSRIREANRLNSLESNVQTIQEKLDMLITLMTKT